MLAANSFAMPYAVLQTDLSSPTLEQLRRATRLVPGLTSHDASILGHDAFGILVNNFSAPQAGALQAALRAEGVETEVVEQARLPVLPRTHFVHRLDVTAEHLVIYDPLGKSFALAWAHLLFIAAGAVRLTDFVRHQQARPRTRYTGAGTSAQDIEYDMVSREERNFHLLADLIITGATLRYSLDASRFNFAGPGGPPAGNLAENFSKLLRDLMAAAPQAKLNRGAAALSGETPQPFSYPSKNAYHEEIIRSLWRLR